MSRTTHLPWTVAGLICAFVVGRQVASEPLVVTDSKGRIRLKSVEDGDAFSLTMCDHLGRPRLTIGCGPAGFPEIRLKNEDGKDLGQWRQESATKVTLIVMGPAGEPVCLASDDSKGAIVGVGHPDGAVHAILGAKEAAGRTELILSQGSKDGTNVKLFQSNKLGGLLFERAGDRLGGLNSDGKESILWFGQDALDKSSGGLGVRLGWDPSTGGSLAMWHKEKAGQLTMQASATQGTGWQLGVAGAGVVRAGVGADGVPKLLVTDKEGGSVLRVPEK